MNIQELRALAMRRHKAATRKVSRLRGNGVEIGGTNADVRVNPANIKRYTTKQLNAYIGRLDNFNSRNNSFAPSANPDRPLRGDRVKYYRGLENKANEIARNEAAAIADIPIGNTGFTVGERNDTLLGRRSNAKRVWGDTSSRIFQDKGTLATRRIASPEALEKLIAMKERQLANGFKEKQIALQRRDARNMADGFGDETIGARIAALSDSQFDIWFNYTNERDKLKRGYMHRKTADALELDLEKSEMYQDDRNDILESLEWAQALPVTRRTATPGRRTKKKK